MPRTAFPLIAMLLVVFAGCNGMPPTKESPSTTPRGEPLSKPSPTVIGTPSNEELGLGLTISGVTSAQDIADRHVGAFSGLSYTRQGEYTLTAANGTQLARIQTQTLVAANHSVWSYRARMEGSIPNEPRVVPKSRIYLNETTAFQALTQKDGTQYVVGRPRELGFRRTAQRWNGQDLIYRVFTDLNVTNIDKVKIDGKTRYRIQGTRNDSTKSPALLGNEFDLHPRGIPEYTFDVRIVAYMAPDGSIRHLHISWIHIGPTLVDQEETYRAQVSYLVRYTDVGRTTVKRPTWTQAALNASRTESGT